MGSDLSAKLPLTAMHGGQSGCRRSVHILALYSPCSHIKYKIPLQEDASALTQSNLQPTLRAFNPCRNEA